MTVNSLMSPSCFFSSHLSSWLLMCIYCLLPSQTFPPRLSPDTLNLCPNKTHDLHPPYPAPKQNRTKLKAKPPGPFFYAPVLVAGPIIHPLYNPDMHAWGIATYIPPLPDIPNPSSQIMPFYIFSVPICFSISHMPPSELPARILPTYTFSMAFSPIHS